MQVEQQVKQNDSFEHQILAQDHSMPDCDVHSYHHALLDSIDLDATIH